MALADDALVTVRDEMLRGYRVVITAERIQRLEAWLVVARVSYDDVEGELHGARPSDFPEETAAKMLAEIDEEYS
jgi:hypothetical protein